MVGGLQSTEKIRHLSFLQLSGRRPYGLDHPTHGDQRVANQLRLEGITVSPSGVHSVWLRHDLETRLKRLLRLEQAVAHDTTLVLAEEQVRLLERHSVDFRCRHVEATQPGELLNQDTFYWGTLKGVGKVYVQVVVDIFCSFAFAKVYTSKMPVTACDLLYDRVLPFYEALGVAIGACSPTPGRVLGAIRSARLRAAAGHGRRRSTDHADSLAAHQRLRRAHESHPP